MFFSETGTALCCARFLFCSLPVGAETVEVRIVGQRFVPAQVVIKAGDTVRWLNEEKRRQSPVLFSDEDGLESERIFPGESWQRVFNRLVPILTAAGRIQK